MAASDRIMFEIYREAGYSRQYRVVYFTELDEHNKEQEINRAAAGEHYYDGFIQERDRDAARRAISDVIRRLNRGEAVDPSELEFELSRLEQG